MNYAQIITHDVANGPGMRLSLFVSGCSRKCKGCFNKVAWDRNYGQRFTETVKRDLIEELAKPTYQGITILGGEPFERYNKEWIRLLLLDIKAFMFGNSLPEKNVWIYTGFTYEELMADPVSCDILKLSDVLVDGPFVEELKNLSLRFRGSSNQRIIDLKKSTEKGPIMSPYMDKDYTGE